MTEEVRPEVTLRFDRGTLVLDGPGAARARESLVPDPFQDDSRVGAPRCEAVHYARVVDTLRLAGVAFEDRVPAWEVVTPPRVDLHAPRPEQEAALAAWTAAARRGVVVMPTGTGKTEVALRAIADSATSTLVVSPVRDLMYQWHRRILRGLGIDAGILGDGIALVRPVTVTTYDSACIHADAIGDRFGLVVFDECHHLPGPVRGDAARLSAAPYRMGLTATPERSDGRHAELGYLIGPVVHETSIAAARGRTLAEYRVVRIPVHLDDAEQFRYDSLSRTIAGFITEKRREDPGYTWQDLCAEGGEDAAARSVQRAFHEKRSIEDRAAEKLRVLEDIFRLHPAERVIVFTGSNAMAREVSVRFLAPCILGHTRKRERLEVLEGFESGAVPVLIANRVLDEGVDLPEAKIAVVLGGLGSSRQAKQRLGRILRRSGGKEAILYEVVTAETREVQRSRSRRRSDAYDRTRRPPV